MKYLLLCAGLLFSFSYSNAQDCGFIDKLDQGDHWTMTNYTAKGKKEGEVKYTVLDKQQADTLTVSLNTVSKTKKEAFTANYEMQCYHGLIFLNMEHFLAGMSNKMEGMEVEIEADQLAVPSSLAIGDSLPEATISMKAGMNGMTFITMVVTVKDRVVVGKETITTPAGTFECYVIEQSTEVAFGARTKTSTSRDYFSTSHGTIRTENFNKKGKLQDYSEVTEMKV